MKLGIVFGSGAARGWAHIGVINELSKLGVRPDIVTGTSIGALVGAALASNRLDDLEQWVKGLTNWEVLGLLDWGLGKGGLVSGEKVFEKVASTLGDLRFEDLDIPFGAVATDLYSGRETWLTQGKIKDAIRCSCAIPGVMTPSFYDNQWLVDGATVNPVPVSLCRALGADFVIAIDLNSDKSHRIAKTKKEMQTTEVQSTQSTEEEMPINENLELPQSEFEPEPTNEISSVDQPLEKNAFEQLLMHGKEYFQQLGEKNHEENKSPNVFAVMLGCIDIMQDRITRAKLAGEPPDIVLQPKLGQYGIMEFHRASELIEEGEKCVIASKSILEYELEHYKALRRDDA